jgi:NTP pyrophosphatase (non-canonical NTP hydrolase)
MSKSKKMYFVYHIPKVKVGMTHDLGSRVFEKQGYNPSDVQILYATRDMEEASELEIAYQKSLGYKVDRMSYKDLMSSKKSKSFKINITDMTTTFPVWKFDIKAYLTKNLDEVINLNTGEKITVTDEFIDWVDTNSIDSQYTKGRSFIYNKALLKFINRGSTPNDINVNYDLVSGEISTKCSRCIFDEIRLWATERGIYKKGDVKTQYVKLQEEAGEVARAIIKNDPVELKDGIGDMVVVLTNLAHLAGMNIEDCIQSAYDVINKRKGSMINGSFVKNETL